MWSVYQQAKAFGSRPSALLGVTDPLASFYFDRAVSTFGVSLEEAIRESTEDKKEPVRSMNATMTMNRWLGLSRFASV